MPLPKLAAFLKTLSTMAVVASMTMGAAACAATEEEEDADVDLADEQAALTSPPITEADMKRIAKPAGMPDVWNQPDSTGFFDERGKCGPTAVANTLRLYGKEISPAAADAAGVHWIIGTRGQDIERYLQRDHAGLGCTLEHPESGGRFLRDSIAQGHPVMIWFMSGSNMNSHWVVAVGKRGMGANEQVIVMSWGRYYAIPMTKLLASWRNVYGIRNPAVVCDATTPRVIR